MIETKLTEQGYIPLDKSLMNRFGVLDLLNGYDDTINFLEKQKGLGGDLKSLYYACLDWRAGKKEVRVGQSATLLRFLTYAAWSMNLDKIFVLEDTLKERMENGKICNDRSKVIGHSLEEQLQLDGKPGAKRGTSQWASASVVYSKSYMEIDLVIEPPPKLLVTREAVKEWIESRAIRECWKPRYDETLLQQAQYYLGVLNGNHPEFKPEQAEDYCFMVAFGIKFDFDPEERWSSLAGHESNRFKTMPEAISAYRLRSKIYSNDHRVIQAMAMLIKSEHKDMNIKDIRDMFDNPDCVDKSWPQFWKFLEDSVQLK